MTTDACPPGPRAGRACRVNAGSNALARVHDLEPGLDAVSPGLTCDVRETVIEMTVATPGCPVPRPCHDGDPTLSNVMDTNRDQGYGEREVFPGNLAAPATGRESDR
jgi:hypothetical protein